LFEILKIYYLLTNIISGFREIASTIQKNIKSQSIGSNSEYII